MLLELLRDPATAATLAGTPAAAYAERRRAVSGVLADHGVDVTGTDGINLWMEVDDERSAVVALAAKASAWPPATPFLVRPDADHLRVTVGAASPAPTATSSRSPATSPRRRPPAGPHPRRHR